MLHTPRVGRVRFALLLGCTVIIAYLRSKKKYESKKKIDEHYVEDVHTFKKSCYIF